MEGSSNDKVVAFRVDSNKIISSGHVMRCLSLADALVPEGVQCVFITADGDMASVIESRGHICVNLRSRWDNLDMDFPIIWKYLDEFRPSFIMVDTYSATDRYIAALSTRSAVGYLGSKSLTASGLSLLVNYSTEIDRDFYTRNYDPKKTRLLLGPQFAPLRNQFWDLPPRVANRANSVLISLGNSENELFLKAFLEKMELQNQLNSLDVYLLVGRYFELSDWITVAESRGNVKVFSGVSEMAKLMLESDFAVSACGTTVYELGACSVPTIGFALVDEQVSSAESLARMGAIAYAGKAFDDPVKCAHRAVDILRCVKADGELRKSLSEKIHAVSDGKGARRIAAAICELMGVDK